MSIKISELPAGTALSGTEEIPIVQSATTKKITAQDVADLASPDLSGLVPYTGAITDVDLGNNDLNAKGIKIKGTAGNGHLNLKHQSSGSTAGGSESVIYADNSGNPKWKNDSNAVQNVMLENSAITGATKTKITYDSKGLVTSGADATTADITDSTNKRYVTDANLVVIGNTSGTNTGDQTNISGNAATVTTNANLTGVVTSIGNATSIANGVITNAMLSNGAVANLSGTNTGDQTFFNPRVQTVSSSATVTAVSTNDIVTITAQAVGLTLANPTGTFSEGQSLIIRIKDNGTARTIAYGTNFRAIGVTAPTTTVISKTTYIGCIYNSTDTKFDIVGTCTEA